MDEIIIVPNVRSFSQSMKESKSYFLCPVNCVITGRHHVGDENGQTTYEYSTLKAVDKDGKSVSGIITVEDVQWHTSIKESFGRFEAPINRVIVGRKHDGDENGKTQYATALVKLNGEGTTVLDSGSTLISKESSGEWFKSDATSVLIGRYHNRDENGYTYYYTGKIIIVPGGTIISRTVKGYTTMEKFGETSVVSMYPKNPDQTGGEYVQGTKIANTYKVTYEIPNINSDHFYPDDSPKCGYGTDPVVGGGLWNVKRNYFADYSDNKMILTTFCVQLDGKTWYPRNPQDIEWNFMIVE